MNEEEEVAHKLLGKQFQVCFRNMLFLNVTETLLDK